MADKRFLRSSITVGNSLATTTSNGSARVTITIDSASTPQYQFIQNKTSLKDIYFEVAEVIRDYLDITYNGTKSNQVVDVEVVLEMFDAFNAGGTTLYTNTITFKGTDGYSYFEDGANYIVSANDGLAQTNGIFYIPTGYTTSVPFFSANGFAYETIASNDEGEVDIEDTTVQVFRICEPKYTPIQIVFVNRFGALESFWFTLRKIDSNQIKREQFKRMITTSTGGYNIYNHNVKSYNVQGKEKFVLNTPYVKQALNKTIDEILLSEQIWGHFPNGNYTLKGGDSGSSFIIINCETGNPQTINMGSSTKDEYCSLEVPVLISGDGDFDVMTDVLPIVCTSTGYQKKTNVDDRLIQYTLEFEYAFDKINNIR